MLIEEKASNKLPTKTSLFFKLSCYNPTLFNTLVQTDDTVYDNTTSVFEFPVNKTIYLIELILPYDEVTIKLLHEKPTTIVHCDKYQFKQKPYRHQLEGIEYGASRETGWMLLDDTGLGKSLQMIYLAEVLKKRENLSHCFIVCGVNSLKYNWASEIEKFSNLSYHILGQKVSKKGKLSFASVSERCAELKAGIKEFFVITNIETLRDRAFADAFNKSKSKFDMVVLDEAHKCKDPTTKAAKTLLKLKSKRCIALTGTIIMNVPENAYVPLKWTGNTKSTYSQFKHMYNMYGGFGMKQVIGFKNLELLNELISSCSLRRLKSEVLDLPDKVYITDYVELYTEQRKLYDNVAEGVIAELNKLDHTPTILEQITLNMRLRQITATPSILSSEVTQSAKMDRVCELAEQIVSQGDKFVVFTTFKETSEQLYNMLSQYNPVICTGNTSAVETEQNKYKFQNDNSCKCFIGTWQKCGTGHTLTAANYLIFVDTPWTDADFAQACDRIYRIGQDKSVFIITIVAKDTYDEEVLKIVSNKADLSSKIQTTENRTYQEKI